MSYVDNALRDMLSEYNVNWENEFPSLREAAEYYGLEAMIEWDELLHGTSEDEVYTELNFHD